MIRRGANLFRRSVGHWVDFARRGAWAIIAAAILSAGAGLYYAAAHLAISTDTTDLLSKTLPFRHDFDVLKKTFPQLHDNIVIVIDGDNADVVANTSAEIAIRLRKQPDLFPYVFDPADDPFFTRNGFLYLDIDTLGNLSDRLAKAQPLLASLANDPTLRGFFGVLGLASDGIASGDAVVQSFEEAGIYSAIGIVLLLLVVMRNAVDTVFVLVPLGLAAVFTIALMVLCRLPFNFANIIALPLLLCLGVGYGIYFVLRHRTVADMATVLATNTPRAVLFSALTTMCSFGTLAISRHRGTQSMGILLFLSLTLALVCTLIVLPAMQQLRERRTRRTPGPRNF